MRMHETDHVRHSAWVRVEVEDRLEQVQVTRKQGSICSVINTDIHKLKMGMLLLNAACIRMVISICIAFLLHGSIFAIILPTLLTP